MRGTKILHANEEQDSREINLQELDSFDSKGLDASINSGTVSPVKRKSTKSSKTISSSKSSSKNSGLFYVFNQDPKTSSSSLSSGAYRQNSQQLQLYKHLDLEKFKIEPCSNTQQHNHKHCRYYHSDVDRRRNGESFGSDLCKEVENHRMCSKGREQCNYSHNRVERLYHVERYKTKFCTKKSAHQCEYRDFCSFAHSELDIKTRLINGMTRDANFYMYYFKTEWCPLNTEHNKAQCVYAHNWQDFRRKPHLFDYDSQLMCENWQGGTFIGRYEDGCPLQGFCGKCHGWKESEYHPMNYKVYMCDEKSCNGGAECGNWHANKNDQRLIKDVTDVLQLETGLSVPPTNPKPEEQQVDLKKLVICNINHVMEILKLEGLDRISIAELQIAIQELNHLPIAPLMRVAEEKGVIPNEKMIKLRKQFGQPARQLFRQVQSKVESLTINDQEYKQSTSLSPQSNGKANISPKNDDLLAKKSVTNKEKRVRFSKNKAFTVPEPEGQPLNIESQSNPEEHAKRMISSEFDITEEFKAQTSLSKSFKIKNKIFGGSAGEEISSIPSLCYESDNEIQEAPQKLKIIEEDESKDQVQDQDNFFQYVTQGAMNVLDEEAEKKVE